MTQSGSPNQIREMYYTADWQLIEEAIDDDADSDPDRRAQYVWGPRYIDDAVLRREDRDDDGYYDEYIRYYLTDVQFSVMATIDETAAIVERVNYTPYGIARHHRLADLDGDGDTDAADETILTGNYGDIYDLPNWIFGLGDVDRDGDVDTADWAIWDADEGGTTLDDGELSLPFDDAQQEDNLRGYAGYTFDAEGMDYQVRFRSYDPGLGRWLERDPLAHLGIRTRRTATTLWRSSSQAPDESPVDVSSTRLYEYGESTPVSVVDPQGLLAIRCDGSPSDINDSVCCQGAFNTGTTAKTVCCKGRLISCVSRTKVFRRVRDDRKAANAIIGCLTSCEPRHCPNFTCDKDKSGDPNPKRGNGPGSFACSECGVYRCAANCLQNAINQASHGNAAGLGVLQRARREAERQADRWCGKCAEGQDPAFNPGCHPGDPIGVPIS